MAFKKDFETSNNVIRGIATTEKEELIEAAPSVPGGAFHFQDLVHFSDTGNRQMAKIVASKLPTVLATYIRL